MKEKLIKLLSVKTIVTFVALGLWIYATTTHLVEGEFFKTIFTVIISFYFGSNIQRKADEGE